MSETELWESYWLHRDAPTRNALIEAHVDYAVHLARRMKSKLPDHVDIDDLVSYGIMGLINAVERYEKGHGAAFRTFAWPHIQGAMIDGLRSMDWVSPSARQRERLVKQAIDSYQEKHGSMPTDEEIAAEIGWSVEDLTKTISEMSLLNPLSLDTSVSDDSAASFIDLLVDPSSPYGGERIETRETLRYVAEGINRLSENEQMVLSLYYDRELTFEEIGAVLGVTRSRISQIHKQAILKIRSYLSRQGVDSFDPAAYQMALGWE